MGTPDYALFSLKALFSAGEEIIGVVTQPDKPKGRGKDVQMTPVKEVALKHGEIEHGQVTRTNHKGEKYHVTVADANPADISKVAYEHNILMK